MKFSPLELEIFKKAKKQFQNIATSVCLSVITHLLLLIEDKMVKRENEGLKDWDNLSFNFKKENGLLRQTHR